MIVLTPSVGHEELLVLVELHRLGLIRHYYNDVWRRRKVTVDEHEWLAERFEEHRTHRGALPERGEAARQPGTPPGAGSGHFSRRRSHPPARSRRRFPRCRARR